MTVLSFIQAREILSAVDGGKRRIRVSLDLGLTVSAADISYKFKEVRLPDSVASFKDVNHISNDETVCYYLEKRKAPQKVKMFSADTNLFYKLVPSTDAPSLEISGLMKYRTQGTTPWQETLGKISALQPMHGKVLDTCCFLGYTAIAAAKESRVAQVFTFERDSNVLELTDYNPWSRELYLDRKIKLTIGDVARGIGMFSAEFFNSVIHDPSRFSFYPELYLLDFYKELFRVLKPGGKLLHHVDCTEEEQSDTVGGVIRRLKDAGFEEVEESHDAIGVTAQK